MVSVFSDESSGDPWMPLSGAPTRQLVTFHTSATVRVTQIQNVRPLDAQIGVFSKKTVPSELHGVLFGGPDASPSSATSGQSDPLISSFMYTYAVLDAAKIDNLPELLEQSGLEHRCLFKNEAFDELKEVAPWIVRLEEGNRFTRFLFTKSDASQHLWDAKPGIFIRSDASLDELYRHFRKFTRIQDEQGKWNFLAYWSHPLGIQLFLRGNEPDINAIAQRILALAERRLMIIVVENNICSVVEGTSRTDQVKPRWLLTRRAWEFIRQIRREQQFDEIVQITWGHAARHVAADKRTFAEALRCKRDQWFGIGFWRRDHLAKLCSWEALLGPHFLESYANGAVNHMLRSSRSPHEAIARIEDLLDAQSVVDSAKG